MNWYYYLRGANNLLRYLIYEFPIGIDFSLRDRARANCENNCYSFTMKKQFKNIIKDIDIKGKSFLDSGSGKGGLICSAYELGASFAKGVELDQKLHNRAMKNIQILHCQDNIYLENVDAKMFKDYDKFDIFFLFNPFNDAIYKVVLENILEQNQGQINSGKFLISYDEANINPLNSSNKIKIHTKKMSV